MSVRQNHDNISWETRLTNFSLNIHIRDVSLSKNTNFNANNLIRQELVEVWQRLTPCTMWWRMDSSWAYWFRMSHVKFSICCFKSFVSMSVTPHQHPLQGPSPLYPIQSGQLKHLPAWDPLKIWHDDSRMLGKEKFTIHLICDYTITDSEGFYYGSSALLNCCHLLGLFLLTRFYSSIKVKENNTNEDRF